MDNKQEIIELLHEGNYSCVIANGSEIRTFQQKGVKDLYDLLHNDPKFLCGASVADKVVGKAAAALMAAGGIRFVYADTISLPALDLLEKLNVHVGYKQLVPHIINRSKTDWCPLEKLCYNIDSLEAVLETIKTFMQTK